MKFIVFPELEADKHYLEVDDVFVSDGENEKSLDELEFSLTEEMFALFEKSNEHSREINETLFYELFPHKSMSFAAYSFRSVCVNEIAENRSSKYSYSKRIKSKFLEITIVNEMINRYIDNGENFTMKEFVDNENFMSSVYRQLTTLAIDSNIYTDKIVLTVGSRFKRNSQFNSMFTSSLVRTSSPKLRLSNLSKSLEKLFSLKTDKNYKIINHTPKTILSLLDKQVFFEEHNLLPLKENTRLNSFIANFSIFHVDLCDFNTRQELFNSDIDEDLFKHHLVEILNFYQTNHEQFKIITTENYDQIKKAIERNNPNKQTPFNFFLFLILVIFKASKERTLTHENIANIVDHMFTIADSEYLVFNADLANICAQCWLGGYFENISANMAINIFS